MELLSFALNSHENHSSAELPDQIESRNFKNLNHFVLTKISGAKEFLGVSRMRSRRTASSTNSPQQCFPEHSNAPYQLCAGPRARTLEIFKLFRCATAMKNLYTELHTQDLGACL